jgi:hypothetical protein
VGETEFIIGFEGSQALPVCPSGKCKHLTGTIEVFILRWGEGYRAALGRKILKLPSGRLHVKHAEQRGIWVPTQHMLWDHGKP